MYRNSGIALCLLVVILFGSTTLFAEEPLPEPNGVPIPPSTIRYNVASPRAAIVAVPHPTQSNHPRMVGAAENFTRENGEIKIPVGTRVVFALSRQLEGVWYPHTLGRLATYVVVQRAVIEPNTPQPQDIEAAEIHWITIGRDGAGDTRHGPSIGRADVGVPVRFVRPGVYLLRAAVITFAQPIPPKPTEAQTDAEQPQEKPERPHRAFDRDIVYIKVKVVNLPANEVVPDEPAPLDPDLDYTIDLTDILGQEPAEVVLPEEAGD